MSIARIVLAATAALSLAACSSTTEPVPPTAAPTTHVAPKPNRDEACLNGLIILWAAQGPITVCAD